MGQRKFLPRCIAAAPTSSDAGAHTTHGHCQIHLHRQADPLGSAEPALVPERKAVGRYADFPKAEWYEQGVVGCFCNSFARPGSKTHPGSNQSALPSGGAHSWPSPADDVPGDLSGSDRRGQLHLLPPADHTWRRGHTPRQRPSWHTDMTKKTVGWAHIVLGQDSGSSVWICCRKSMRSFS